MKFWAPCRKAVVKKTDMVPALQSLQSNEEDYYDSVTSAVLGTVLGDMGKHKRAT